MARRVLICAAGAAVMAGGMALFLSGCGSIPILMGRIELIGPREQVPAGYEGTGTVQSRGASDWPRWRGPDGTGKSSLTGIRTDWEGGLERVWEVAFLCQGKKTASWGAPVVHGDRLVVSGRDDGRDLIFCLHAGTGRLLWQGSYLATAPTGHGSGSRATPCIDGDKVYAFGRAGDVVCWGLEDGRKIWYRNVSDVGGVAPKWGHSSSPLTIGNKVIVQAGGEALAVAYDKETGDIAWKSPAGPAAYAAPVPFNDGRRVLVFGGSGLACLDTASGKQLWLAPWVTAHGVNATTPAVSGDTVFVTSGYQTGGQALRMRDDGFDTLWTTKALASQHSDPIILDGHLYGYTGQSYQNKGEFVCVELGTGAEKWRSDEIGWGTTVHVDGHFLCLDIKGDLYLVKAGTDGLVVIAEHRGILGEVSAPAWTCPIVANGRMYLRYLQRMYCYDLMPAEQKGTGTLSEVRTRP